MPDLTSKYVLYVHYESDLKTVSEFLDGPKAITGMPESDFLKYTPTDLERRRTEGDRNVTVTVNSQTGTVTVPGRENNAKDFEQCNLERIYSMYDSDERREYKNEFGDAMVIILNGFATEVKWSGPLKVNTVLAVPSEKLRREIVAMKGKNTVSQERSTTAFVGNQLSSLLRDPGYQKYSDPNRGAVKKEHPTISVWIWLRAMSDGPLDQDLEGTILDISKFVETCQTSVGPTGGTFTITLPPIMTNYNGDMWGVDEDSIIRKPNGNYVSKGSLNKVERGELRRNSFFFHTAINSNDVVWIRMETLDSEIDSRSQEAARGSDIVSPYELPGNVYDMIGLVDNCSQVSNFEATDVLTTINGRDLSKLIIDDGAYLQPLLFFKENFLGEEGQIIQRNAFNGAYADLSFARYNTIEDALTFLINVVSNIEVTPDKLFSAGYGSDASLGLGVTNTTAKDNRKPGNLKKLELKIYGLLAEAGILRAIPVIHNAATQLKNFNNIIDFATEIIDLEKKFVSWDSYKVRGELSNLADPSRINSQPQTKVSSTGIRVESTTNFEISGSSLFIKGLTKAQRETYPQSPYLARAICAAIDYVTLQKTTDQVAIIKPNPKGIWQIVELVIDEGVRHRTIADSSMSQPDGSLINQFFKFCQKPFVEFYTDTYGDKFNFIVREPPFDQAKIRDFINTGLLGQMVIDDVDVINENLSFSTEAYSWYEIDPQSVNFGNTNSLFSKIPIVLFEEYAKIFGSNKFTVVSNYISWMGRIHEKEGDDANYLLEQVLLDLKYLIDSHAYLPFTREGTIVINGDRRFKRGTWIRYLPTREIFYVDEVTNDFMHTGATIDRVTMLKVSRGMVEKYVSGEVEIEISDGSIVPLTYFNIIDTDLIMEFAREQLAIDGKKKPTINPKTVNKVIKEVFNFFMKRQQFSGVDPMQPYIGPIEDGSKFNNFV